MSIQAILNITRSRERHHKSLVIVPFPLECMAWCSSGIQLDILGYTGRRDRWECSPGVYTWEDGEACHEFHAVAIIVRKKYGKFLNTMAQVSLFPTTSQDTILFFILRLISI